MTEVEAVIFAVVFCVIGAVPFLAAIFGDSAIGTRLASGALGAAMITAGVLIFKFYPRRGPR